MIRRRFVVRAAVARVGGIVAPPHVAPHAAQRVTRGTLATAG